MIAVLIAIKDTRQRIRDKSAITLGLVAPLGLAIIFSLIIPDVSAGEFTMELGVVGVEQSEMGALFQSQVVDELDDALFAVTYFDTASEARAAVERLDVFAAIEFPDGIDAAVAQGGGQINVITTNEAPISGEIATSIARQFGGDVSGVQLAVAAGLFNGGTDPEALAALTVDTPIRLAVVDSQAADRQLDISTFFAAGMSVFFLFFTVQFAVSGLVQERTDGTLPRLLSSPIHPGSIIAGKGLAALALGVVSMFVLITATSWQIGANWGNPIGVGMLVFGGVLSAIGIMAMIATVARTAEQASTMQSVVAVVLGLLGGSLFPVSQGPVILSKISLATPHAWFLRGLADLAGGDGPSAAVPAFLALLAFAFITGGLASIRIRKMVRL
ncbi:MAG: ABC transporter permease [Acidobacteria bacterium]|nr:ABC transporter permease [Acidobacteriota bacterium]